MPSQAPVNFTVASQTSTSILASWQLPPTDSRNGIIIGFKLFHKRKGSTESGNTELVQGGTTFRKTITGLHKYTEYEVQVLAFTAVGDGPKTHIKTVRTFCKWNESNLSVGFLSDFDRVKARPVFSVRIEGSLTVLPQARFQMNFKIKLIGNVQYC